MSVRKRRACALALASLLATARGAAALDAIAPDAKLQRVIAEVPAAKSPAELDAALAKLQASTAGDTDTLLPQLLYFSMRGADVRESMTAGVVLDRLQISKAQLFRAIVPYLDTTEPGLQRQLRNVLSAVDETADAQAPDFSLYATVLRERPDNPPVVLVTHMFDTAPDAALESLTEALIGDVAARRALRDAAKSNDQAAIERLAQDKAWWVRLSLVIRMRREPALATPALTQRLRNDTHPAVRAAAGALAQP